MQLLYFCIMATISFILRGTKKRKKIYVSLSIEKGKVFQRATKWSIEKSDWNKKVSRPKQTNTYNKNLKKDLDNLQNDLFFVFDGAIISKTKINGEWLSNQMKISLGEISLKGRSNLISENVQYLINTAPYRENVKKELGLSESRINSYKALKKIIKELRPNAIIKDVDPDFSRLFLQDMIKIKSYSQNHASKRISDLKTVCIDAQNNGIEVSSNIRNIKVSKQPNKQTVTLTRHELQLIKDVDTLTDAEDNARKWLLFGCRIGQRVGDLLAIKERNFIIENDREFIEITQEKTGARVKIPITKQTKEIIKNGLPYRISDQKLNVHIKEVCRKAGLTYKIKGSLKIEGRAVQGLYPKHKLIVSHVFRRTFATLWYGNINTAWIKMVTGHKTEISLMRYIGEQEDKTKEMYDVYDNFENMQTTDNETTDNNIKNVTN